MRTLASTTLAIVVLSFVTLPSGLAAEAGPSLDGLQGKWTANHTGRDGRTATHVFELKNDQLQFQRRNAEGEVRFVAKATVKSEKAGPFRILRLTKIEAGRSADDLQSVDQERCLIYLLHDEHLFVAANFDEARDNEPPGMDSYTRQEGAPAAAAGPAGGEEKLLGTWNLEFTMGNTTRDYDLRITRPEGKLNAVLISPRSGEHPCKSIAYVGDELVLEIERTIQDTLATIVYRAKFNGDQLQGTAAIKGYEDQFRGTVKASKAR